MKTDIKIRFFFLFTLLHLCVVYSFFFHIYLNPRRDFYFILLYYCFSRLKDFFKHTLTQIHHSSSSIHTHMPYTSNNKTHSEWCWWWHKSIIYENKQLSWPNCSGDYERLNWIGLLCKMWAAVYSRTSKEEKTWMRFEANIHFMLYYSILYIKYMNCIHPYIYMHIHIYSIYLLPT